AGARAADARLAQGLRPDLPDDRRRARRDHPPRAAVHLRGRLHRIPPGLRLGDLLHLLLHDHHRLDRLHGDRVPTECEGMSAANPTTATLTPVVPRERSAAVAVTSS